MKKGIILACLVSPVLASCCSESPSTGNDHATSISSQRSVGKIKRGMALSEVVKLHGGHYKIFVAARANQFAIIYDDITVSCEGVPIETEMYRATVTSIEPTTPQINWFVEKAPYADEKKESL